MSDRDTDGAVDPEGAVPAPVPFLDLHGVHAALRDPLNQAWSAVLGHGRFINGPEVAAFEGAFAEYCEAEHCVGVANGTDALELILAGLGIGPGDEVLVPTNTFVATAEAVVTVGATPRFVDVLPDTLLIDPDAAAAAIGPRTAAIMAVHLFGQMTDMPALSALASKHGLALIEDAAQAHGARFAGRRAGGGGVAAGFSFYPGKNLGALGDGGAVVSNDAALVGRIRQLADHGRSQTDRYGHEVVGRNSRLDTLQAAALHVKLPVLDEANRARAAAVAQYRKSLPAWCVPVGVHPHAEPVYHLAVVQVPDRAATARALDAAGIGWGIHYPVPCHLQPAFARYAVEPLPVAEAAAEHILSLPLSPTLTNEQVERVSRVLDSAGP
ncbi:DegT/DnrJ/EryC1/StrS family aminotransferase [Pseudonocardia charpentierae]|uniref:DegT/DnrJ/EryC1/StrS family aminotransferase n=1 Tax=Pseudonocardia charpentierae TaxID=3075545 RepID=A0ABU2N4K5_9PSEU|nr:DegT/DnrJ/EryC1/StrS family aminotransferase [Pseudonocardia sp. DSM 45834]MDT0348700.1 DegT/DnrJ/EryC1/StrS family aminotransferase [Pseudonocardia sp. DSM 45834]